MADRTGHALLILADISGYTGFMLANQLTLVHGQLLITHLLESIIAEVEIPLEVEKIEGDAVFLYALDPGDEAAWRAVRTQVAGKLLRFFRAFADALVASADSTICPCATCRNADRLELKVVVHCGEVLFHTVGRFRELAGVDVILVHRLLKNDVPGGEYLLLTDAARDALPYGDDVPFETRRERQGEFGEVSVHVHRLDDPRPDARRRFLAGSRAAVALRAARANVRGVMAQIPAAWRTDGLERRNGVAARPLRRHVTRLALMLSTPFEIVMGALAAPFVAARRGRDARSRPGGRSPPGPAPSGA